MFARRFSSLALSAGFDGSDIAHRAFRRACQPGTRRRPMKSSWKSGGPTWKGRAGIHSRVA